MNDTTFVSQYIAAWSTTSDEERNKLVDQLYAPDAVFYNEMGEVHGQEAIAAQIKSVNVRDIQNKGIQNHLLGFEKNHNLLNISWQMLAPNDAVVADGASILLLDDDGKIVQDYIFVRPVSQ